MNAKDAITAIKSAKTVKDLNELNDEITDEKGKVRSTVKKAYNQRMKELNEADASTDSGDDSTDASTDAPATEAPATEAPEAKKPAKPKKVSDEEALEQFRSQIPHNCHRSTVENGAKARFGDKLKSCKMDSAKGEMTITLSSKKKIKVRCL